MVSFIELLLFDVAWLQRPAISASTTGPDHIPFVDARLVVVGLDRSCPHCRSVDRTGAQHSFWLHALLSHDQCNQHPWSLLDGRLRRQQNPQGVLWRIGGILACLMIMSASVPHAKTYCHVPSLRCLSSNILKAAKEAPPASTSWLNSAWLSLFWTWL